MWGLIRYENDTASPQKREKKLAVALSSDGGSLDVVLLAEQHPKVKS